MNCSGNSQSAVHVSVSGDDAVQAVFASFEIDGSLINGAALGDCEFKVADHFVALADDQDVLHAVIVSQKDFDVASRSGVLIGVPADRGDRLDDEACISRNGVIRGA